MGEQSDLPRSPRRQPASCRVPPVLSVPVDATTTQLRIFGDSERALHEATDVTVADAARLRGTTRVTWVDVVGLSDLALTSKLCGTFDIHPPSRGPIRERLR